MELPAEVADGSKPYYASTGIEKAVALARYTDLMHTWWVAAAVHVADAAPAGAVVACLH